MQEQGRRPIWPNSGPLEVKPRQLDPNPRCYECKSPDPRGRAPMFHPEHKWEPCWVRMPSGEECGCMAGVQTRAWPDFPDPTL